MKDGGRIAAAIEIMEAADSQRRPVQDCLKDWGIAHRFAGSRDRNAIGNLVFDALRRRRSLGALMGEDSARATVLAAYVLLWGRSVPALEAALADDRHAPAALGEEERQRLAAGILPEGTPDAVAADVPDWLAPSLARAFGREFVEEGRGLAGRPDVDLRVNTLKGDRDALVAHLADSQASACVWSPVGVRVPAGIADGKPANVSSEIAYKRGLFEIQDEASQIAALIAATGEPRQVIDLCAGAGGKSLAIAAALANRGQIYAYDSDRRRFGDIVERIARSGAHNIQIREPRKADPLHDLAGRADVVLVDAPCTGSGTWRRRPDAKWRLAPGALELRQKEQEAVLADAVRLVAPRGRIVYVTCSVLPEENEDRVAAFLAGQPDFKAEDTALRFATVTGHPPPERCRIPLSGGGTAIRLTPASAGTDGFFVAVLSRG